MLEFVYNNQEYAKQGLSEPDTITPVASHINTETDSHVSLLLLNAVCSTQSNL